MSVAEINERKKWMVFVGNIPLDVEPKWVHALFKDAGKLEKIWFRSFLLDKQFESSKI